MDQGGSVMSVENGKTGTLRAEMHGHEPLVIDKAYCISGHIIGRSPFAGSNGTGIHEEIAPTLTTADRHAVYTGEQQFIIDNHRPDARFKICADNVSPTLTANMGTGGGNGPMILDLKGNVVDDE